MKWFKIIFLNKWSICLYILYCIVWLNVKAQNRYAILLQESTGRLYHANLIKPEYVNYLHKFNIFDGDDIYNIKSFNVEYFHYIGNINRDDAVDNVLKFTTLKIIPSRKFVDNNNLPASIKNLIAQNDIYEVDVTGLESLGLTKFTMITDDSGWSLDSFLKERSKKFKEKKSSTS